MDLPASWNILESETKSEYFIQLTEFLHRERTHHQVFPCEEEVFAALAATPFDSVRVLLLGQDPYHGEGQAHGLCFSVNFGVKIPPSLRNIYKELNDDLGCEIPDHGHLISWAKQGVLMLNTVLTVRADQANSHRKQGWEKFTDAVIRAVNQKDDTVVFVLWGSPARRKKKLIDESRHVIVESPHPSPLSAHRGFFGSKPFSVANAAIAAAGFAEIDWQIN